MLKTNSFYNLKFFFLSIKNKIQLFIKRRREYKMLLDFFNIEKPCPSYIKMCKELREELEFTVHNIKNNKQCTNCGLKSAKAQIIAKLLHSQDEISNDVNNDQVMIDFFNFELPCPQSIPFCEQLRQKYKEELDKLTVTGCSTCKKNSLKAKYIKEIWENHISKTI
jgi:predicted nucleic acid-binding protein